jgi:HEAT repeat protein
MGRSADERWAPQVCAELESISPELRFEAARAVGELEVEDAVPALIKMGADSDRLVREAAIWSLSQVGGEAARKALKRFLRQADPDEKDFVQDALDNLDFTDEVHSFALLNIGSEDELDANEA